MSGSRARGLVVEFAGLPGAGKSTLSHALAEVLRQRGRRVAEPTFDLAHRASARRRQREKLRLALRTAAGHPGASLAAARAIHASGQQTSRDLAASAWHFLFLCGLLEDLARKPGLHVLDQGLANGLWSVGFSARRPAPLARLAALGRACAGPAPWLVVLLDVPPALVAERLQHREGVQSRLEVALGTRDFGARLATAASVLEATRRVLEEVARTMPGVVRLAVVPNDGSVSVACRARELADVVEAQACGDVAD